MPSAGSTLEAIASAARWFDRNSRCNLVPHSEDDFLAEDPDPRRKQPMQEPPPAPDQPVPTDVPVPEPMDVPVPEPMDVPPPTPTDPYVPKQPRPIP